MATADRAVLVFVKEFQWDPRPQPLQNSLTHHSNKLYFFFIFVIIISPFTVLVALARFGKFVIRLSSLGIVMLIIHVVFHFFLVSVLFWALAALVYPFKYQLGLVYESSTTSLNAQSFRDTVEEDPCRSGHRRESIDDDIMEFF